MATRTITIQTTPFSSGVSGFSDPHIFDAATERENQKAAGNMAIDEAALRMGINAALILSNPPAIIAVGGQFATYYTITSLSQWASFRGITFNSN
jgi:hypothetical protein